MFQTAKVAAQLYVNFQPGGVKSIWSKVDGMGARCNSKNKLAITNENWKNIKNKLIIYFNLSLKCANSLIQ